MTNEGLPLDMGWVLSSRVNKSAVDRRAAEIGTRRSVKKKWQVAWELRAIQCIDLTTLAGDDTPGNVLRLCAKARNPVKSEILEKIGINSLKTGAVCVYPNHVREAVKALAGSGIPVASVATGFPAGQTPLETRLQEITFAVNEGAEEIDIVISRTMLLLGDWEGLYNEVKQMKKACGNAHLKTILATGEIPTYTDVYRASLVCMMAGADFIKTSTGKEPVNAVMPIGIIMARAIREYYERTGVKVGFKPAGGIRAAKDSVNWLIMMMEELGEEWTHPHLFRIGASTLLPDLERQLYHEVFGRYHGKNYIPLG
eukprot:TRINITY_DN2880_c0_g1_i1.p1 TRINITY_DN2880_c0_g1~~TRINITY_DN2880_c0_g1_i1.p1  ORF type:complete len:327 (-),score=129.63 TRINITY_DN2880_c0_g1_i1:58-996(-)